MAETPTTAAAAAELVLALDGAPQHLAPDHPYVLAGLADAWTDPMGMRVDRARRLVRQRQEAEMGVNYALPPVLNAVPARLCQGYWLMPRDPDPGALAANDAALTALAPDAVRAGERPRVTVLSDPDDQPATPAGTHVLAVAVLACDQAAELATSWAAKQAQRDATRLRAEAAAYRDYSARCQALIPASASWAAAVTPRLAVQAFPTVPATPRGWTQSGPIPN